MSSTPFPLSISTPCKNARLPLGKSFCPVWMLNNVVPLPEDGQSGHYFMRFSYKYEVLENNELYIDLYIELLLVYWYSDMHRKKQMVIILLKHPGFCQIIYQKRKLDTQMLVR